MHRSTDASVGEIPMGDRHHDRQPRGWRIPRASEVLSALALVGAVLVILGWRYNPPSTAIAEEVHTRRIADSLIDLRIAEHTRRLDEDENQLWFSSYLQCSLYREIRPASVPPICGPIMERGPHR